MDSGWTVNGGRVETVNRGITGSGDSEQTVNRGITAVEWRQ
jgi:hypothetical protein